MGGSKRRFVFARAIMGAALAAAVLFAAGPGAAAGEPERMISGSWELDRFDDESTGIFSDCSIAARYGSSRVLVFLLDRDSAFLFSLSDPGLRFDDNVPYRAVLSIDGRHIGDYKTQVKDRAGFGFLLPYTDGMIYALKHGRRVAISVAGKTHKFSLTGTLVALTDLERCVARGMQPAAGGGRQSAPAETRPTTRVEGPDPQILADRRRFLKFGADDDWAFVNRLLDSVGLGDFE